MSTRLTETDKWRGDPWFIKLSKDAKLLFLYLCDVCDPAGFVEREDIMFSRDTGIDDEEIPEILKELASPYKGVYKVYIRSIQGASEVERIWLVNRVKLQVNGTDLTGGNKFIPAVLKRFQENALLFPEVSEVYTIPEGAYKGYAYSLKRRARTSKEEDSIKSDAEWAEEDEIYRMIFEEPMVHLSYDNYRLALKNYPKVNDLARLVREFLIGCETEVGGVKNPYRFFQGYLKKQESTDASGGGTGGSAAEGTVRNGQEYRSGKWRKPWKEMSKEEQEAEERELLED